MTAAALTVPPKHGHPTFLFSELALDLNNLQADIAFLGVPYGQAYPLRTSPTIRAASDRYAPPRPASCARLSAMTSILAARSMPAAHPHGGLRRHTQRSRRSRCPSRRTEQAVRAILAAGALPIVLGGDHGVPIPVLRAFEGRGPITLVQIDQHIDWRDEVNGVARGCPARSGAHPKWNISVRSSRSGCVPPEAHDRRRWTRHWLTART